ncbi:MAG TPA: presqualene diphosphate synthase HpnD [Methylomirabilota bacterium]|jgi:phytoene synthase|nr:presqualene diphosphate synthase HpnD [Methylomirabilota bacterium]
MRPVDAGRFVSRLTRRSRSNFFYAFLCLPRREREAIYAVYAFCRIVDDAVDLGRDRPEQRRELDRWRDEVARAYDGVPEHPAGQRLQQAVRTFPIPRAALLEIIAGVEMDLEHAVYETFDDLYPYCYRVASAVGLCCIEIFGYADPRAREYAINLGIALQLTNILRDVQADARGGRVYIPQEDLRRFGVTAEHLAAGRYTSEFVALMGWEAARARRYYERAWAALPPADARRLFAAEIMGRTYFALLRAIEARRFRVFGERVTLPAYRRVGIALSCWLRSRWGDGRAVGAGR